MKKYQREIEKMLESLTPWEKRKSGLEGLRNRVKPGEIVVIPDATDNLDDPLYKGAKIMKG